ncbi:MAG: hypothetical protein LBI57_03795 [Helicobacteraceae bacterium]|jgi:hypothetical protein|nr:hypothetical protein [Helicobacteraceae bacterium]
MRQSDSLIVNLILKRGGEIYSAQKRFGADPSILSLDSAYFNAIAMDLLQISLAALKFTPEFRSERKKTAWEQIDSWSATIVDRYETLTALDLWAALEDFAELYGECFTLANSR